tara:strand:- start:284 stop:484 length:201 start_codon:yes stop_codon:yes gene_type:complete
MNTQSSQNNRGREREKGKTREKSESETERKKERKRDKRNEVVPDSTNVSNCTNLLAIAVPRTSHPA